VSGGKIEIPGYSADEQSMIRLSDTYGIHDAIHEVIANMNDVYGGKITLDYTKLG